MVLHTGVLLWCYRLRVILRRLLFCLFFVQVRVPLLSPIIGVSVYPTNLIK